MFLSFEEILVFSIKKVQRFTFKKERKILKEAAAKSYMTNGFLVYY
jgi:hypothetical protein